MLKASLEILIFNLPDLQEKATEVFQGKARVLANV